MSWSASGGEEHPAAYKSLTSQPLRLGKTLFQDSSDNLPLMPIPVLIGGKDHLMAVVLRVAVFPVQA